MSFTPTERNAETCSHLISYVSAALQTLETDRCLWEAGMWDVMKEKRVREGGIAVCSYDAAPLFRGHGRSFQDPLSKSFLPLLLLLSSLSPPEEHILYPIPPSPQNKKHIPLRRFLPASPMDSFSSSPVHLSLPHHHILLSFLIHSTCRVGSMDCCKTYLTGFCFI